nr:hypothetical protein [uncultured Marinifilum sp.]
MKTNQYYISRNYRLGYGGSKAKIDCEDIFAQNGFKNISQKRTTIHQKIIGFITTFFGVMIALLRIKKGGTLIMQYSFRKYYNLIRKTCKRKGCELITVVHDLRSLQKGALTIEEEIRILNDSDYLIVHNPKMKQWLTEQNCTAKMVNLGIFDYLSEKEPNVIKYNPNKFEVVFAGKISKKKNKFLFDLDRPESVIQFNIYSKEFEQSSVGENSNIVHKGFFHPEDLIEKMEGHFGLVWDGDSTEACTGIYGEYLRYNNPHKTSLYIRCHLPIIIWKKAALADFVSKYNIGICIDSLEELDNILRNMTEAQYNKLRDNTAKVSDMLKSGHFLSEAIKNCR